MAMFRLQTRHQQKERSSRRFIGVGRAIDVVLVLLLTPLLLPLAGLIAAAIVTDSPGPALFRCERVGRGGRRFRMLKFRTMVHGSEGPPLRGADDPRHTPVGALLSRWRLDELPQLWHVLRGDMRLVGPRPEAPEFVAERPDAFAEILSVPPGLTGATQLVFSDEAKVLSRVAEHDRGRVYREHLLPGKVEMDLTYVRRRSLAGDLHILVRTLWLPVLRRDRAAGDLVKRFSMAAVTVGFTLAYSMQIAAPV